MGIKNLNRLIRENCAKSVTMKTMSEFTGKKIVIDSSIYMYKYEKEGTLLENFYLMLGAFRYYNIIPIFIFDGKPPIEKKELLAKRRYLKVNAEKEYNKIKEQLDTDDPTLNKTELMLTMDKLKNEFIHITKEKIASVKELIRAYGASYYDAPGEADELCVSLVLNKKVYACLSEDMDMFVYGCPRVLRYMSLINHTFVLYETYGIFEELHLSLKEFRDICVLSGTDYFANQHGSLEEGSNLDKTLILFKEYSLSKNGDFYNWLLTNKPNYIKNYDHLVKINNMFDIKTNKSIQIFENVKIMNGPILMDEVQTILKEDGFIFLKNKVGF